MAKTGSGWTRGVVAAVLVSPVLAILALKVATMGPSKAQVRRDAEGLAAVLAAKELCGVADLRGLDFFVERYDFQQATGVAFDTALKAARAREDAIVLHLPEAEKDRHCAGIRARAAAIGLRPEGRSGSSGAPGRMGADVGGPGHRGADGADQR